jgi:transcriptional regulator with XRE-family HTH domain
MNVTWEFDSEAFVRLREDRGLTREAVGECVGRAASAVREWELGRHAPKDRIVPVLAHALGVPVEELRRSV